MGPLRRRWAPALGLFLAAPICAEYLQAYLETTGNALALLAGLLVLAPLYGGAALLLREVAIRTRRGWPGIVLLAAAFGVLMPGIVDLALFGEHRADVGYWDDLRLPTLIEPWGISAFTTTTWVFGHVVMSISVPLALLDGLVPRIRGRSLLGPLGMIITGVLFVLAAIMVHLDGRHLYGSAPTLGQTLAVLGVVGLLALLGLSRWGRTIPRRRPVPVPEPRPVPRWAAFVLGAVGVAATNLVPPTWLGVAIVWAVVLSGVIMICLLVRSGRWPQGTGVALAAGALVATTAVAFAAPVPLGVSPVAKYAQNAVLLILVVAVAAAAVWRSRLGPQPPVGQSR
ncbi:hypothetical protein ACQCX2_05250 [Propionibacteriaceae bacterium Y1700]|uniref:hypothetical protein n=1 Tax=Microlunatus sp. Y1700 TaxID=3418487 RepID=UPI003DA6FBA8